MNTSEHGKLFIKGFEDCRLEAYQDIAGVWTIGWGRTRHVKPGDTCSQEEADFWFEEEILEYEGYVNLLVNVPLEQHEFDALVSFTYNLGPDIDDDKIAEGLGDSTLLKKLNAGDKAGAADEFLNWNKARVGGVLMPIAGLTRRRRAERDMFRGREM